MPLSEVQWLLATFPIRFGGLGVQDPVRIHAQAAMASFILAAGGASGVALSRRLPDLDQALNLLLVQAPSLASALGPLWRLDQMQPIISDQRFEQWATQRVWSEEADLVAVARFDHEASSRLACLPGLQAGPHAGGWVTAVPGGHSGSPTFSAAEWQALLRFRCGVPFGGRVAVLLPLILLVIMPWGVLPAGYTAGTTACGTH